MSVTASDGTVVTDAMIDGWCAALDRDEWPEGWRNVGDVREGVSATRESATETLSVKVPPSMKEAIDRRARVRGESTSAYVRAVLAESLIASA